MKSDMSSSTKLLLKKITLRTLYTIIGFILFIWIFSPSISHFFLSDYLKNEMNLTLSEETSIRLNLFTNHLTISDLSITAVGETSKNQKVFELKSFNAEIRLHRLIVKQLYISELSIEGLFLLAVKQNDLLRVSGILIPVSNNDQNDAIEADNQAEDDSTFEVLLPQFSFSKSEIQAKLDGVYHTYYVNLLSIEALLFSQQKQELTLALDSTFDLAPLTLNSKVSLKKFKGLITNNLVLSKFNLEHIAQFLPESIKRLNGDVSFSHTNKVNLTDDGISIDSDKSELSLNNIAFQDELLKASQKSLKLVLNNMTTNIDLEGAITSEIKGIDLNIDVVAVKKDQFLVDINEITSKFENLTIKMPKDEKLNINLKGVFNINRLATYANNRNNLVAQFDSFDAGKISLQLAEKLNLQIEEFGVTNAVYSKIISEGDENNNGMLGFSRFAINDFLFNEELLSIDNIKLSGLYGNISIDKNGDLQNSVSLADEDNDEDKNQSSDQEKPAEVVADKSEENQKTPLIILVKNIEVVESNTIAFSDQSVASGYKRDIFIDQLSMTDLDSSKPDSESPFVLKGRSDKYTKIDFSGFVKPFTEKLNLKLKGALTEVSLPPASIYIRDALTFDFESGELDTHIDLEINDAIIGGSTLIKIRGMALASAENNEQNMIQEQTSLPLNVALGMLKDSNDNVELDIPMYGDIASPVFGISSFIGLITQKAVQSAATDYLMTTFVPYANIVSLTLSAADFIMKLRFEDLPYENGQTEISESQMEYMNQFVALMKDKKDAQVKVCAIATASELTGLGYSSVSADDEKLKSEQVTKLKELSKQRMIRFKEFVVEQSIESKRILLCSPKIDLKLEINPTIKISV
ncbi:MAG: hypothetical protein COA86_05270 [Kangiella sp.]|nr:MAG: hypothetical protein COA86_05270 [Kangiella sp.]